MSDLLSGEQMLGKYEVRFVQELSLNPTQEAHTGQLISDLMDELIPIIERQTNEDWVRWAEDLAKGLRDHRFKADQHCAIILSKIKARLKELK